MSHKPIFLPPSPPLSPIPVLERNKTTETFYLTFPENTIYKGCNLSL